MSFRDRFRKLKSDTKSRIFQANKNDNTDVKPGQPSANFAPGASRNWIHLRTFLRTLEQSTRPLPPIKAAIAELAACIESYANLFHERKEYDTLYYELEELFQVLQYHCTQYIPPAITATVEALCKSIQNEISDIHQKQDKAKLRQYLEAKQDSDAVLAGYRRIQGYLQRISLNADISMWRLMDEVATDNRLNRLSSSLSACYNSAQAVELKRGPCTKGTRVELLSQMLSWVDCSNPGSVYWMSGMAGTGKTTIAYNLCLELDANRRLGASFFCSRLFPECRNVHLIIPSIAYQLARSSRPFRFKLAGVLEKDPDVHTRLPYLQFDVLLAQPLLEVKDTLSDNLVVVIDALDECDNKESTSQILDVLLANASDLPVKFVISSRPEPEIRDEMMKQGNQAESRVVLHELDRYVVQADIETYLRATLAQLDPTEEQIAALVERAGILFIYAATVVRYISHDRFRRNPRARLCNILESSSSSENKHKEIDELYATILRAGLDDHTLDSGERKDIRLVLHTAICAQEPLTTDALSGLLGINDIERVRTALRPLWSVLHVSGASELVTTLHASFPDYMLDPSRSGQYHCNPKMHNQTIARFCFDYFRNVRPQFNICVLESSYVRDDEVEGLEERVQSAITTGLFYAARYWAMHLRSATESPDLLKELEEFLSARLLLWMEVMNLKKCAGAMPQTIRLVETWGAERSAELSALIHDAWRFTSTFALGAVSDSTPHIYTSMLPFWPESSPIGKRYARHLERIIQAEGTAIGQRQHALLNTWTLSHVPCSFAFSPDGTQIAVGTMAELLLLNSSTGSNMLPPFERHRGSIHFVQFSPDGTCVVSVSSDETINICIWSTRTGELVLGPLEGHLDDVCSVAFSPDGARFVSGSLDGQIFIWDARTGECILDLYSTENIPLGFSPDGCSIVSCDEFGNIAIWDAQDGRVLSTFGSCDSPNSFTAPDISLGGSRITTLPFDEGIYIWNCGTGQVVLGPRPVLGFEGIFGPLCFSPNGLHIVSGLGRDVICMWDIRDGDIALGPLEEHTSDLTLVSFSPDGAYFISGSYDKTLRLWDAQSMKLTVRPLDGHTSLIKSVGFSPDGTRIVSSSNDRTICVWDAESGEIALRSPKKGYSYPVQASFSPDASRIISTTNRSAVLLDSQTGDVVLGPLGYSKTRSVGCSQDGTRVVSSRADSTVQILAADTGQTLMTIHLPLIDNKPSQVNLAVLSPDATRIVVGLDTSTLGMYDTHNGRLLYRLFDACTLSLRYARFSPDSIRIAYRTETNLVVKDVQSGEEVFALPQEHTDLVASFEFSPDGSRIVSGSMDGSIRIWNARTGQLLLGPAKWHTGSIGSVKFSPDGTRIVSGSHDKTIRVSDIQLAPTVNNTPTQEFREWEMKGDGWVVDELSRLLVWIPTDLRSVLMWPRTKLLISRKGHLRLNFENARLGEAWTECHHPAW